MDRFYQRIILDALDNGHLLTEWEIGYIDDLAEKDNDYALSEKQKEILLRIENKVATG